MAFALGERQMDRQMLTGRHAAAGSLLCRGDAELVAGGDQCPAPSPAGVGTASQLVCVPNCHLAGRGQPPETPAPSPRLCQGIPQARDHAAQTGDFTPKSPDQRPGSHPTAGRPPLQQSPLPSAHPPELAKHSLGKEPPNSFCPEGAIKSLVAIAGALEHCGDRPAAQQRSLG